MKHQRLFIFIFFVVFQLNGQEMPSYNSIMGIERYHLPKDFNIYSRGVDDMPEVIKVARLRSEYSSGNEVYKISSLKTYQSNGAYINEEKLESFAGAGMYDFSIIKKYSYNDNNQLTEVALYKDKNTPVNEGTTYSYFSDGSIKEISTYVNADKNTISYLQPKVGNLQKETKDNTITYTYETIPYGDTRIHKIESIDKNSKQSEVTEYLYTDEERAVGVGNSRVDYSVLLKITHKSSKLVKEYFFDSEGSKRLLKEVRTDLISNKVYTDNYHYKLDDYGNWIMRYIDRKGYDLGAGLPTIEIREISYEDGEIRGTIDVNNETFKGALKDIKTEIFLNRNKSTAKNEASRPDGIQWTKNNDGTSYGLYINRKGIANQCTSYFIANDLIVFYPENKTVYKLEDFTTKVANTYHKGVEVLQNVDYGFGFKTEGGSFRLFDEKGMEYNYDEVFAKFNYDDKGHFISTKKDGVKLVLEHAKEYATHVIYAMVPFDKTIHQTSNVIATTSGSTDAENITCISGDCENGFGKVQLPNNETIEGFFENGAPHGPSFLNKPESNIESFSSYNGDYNKPIGFEYHYTKDKSSLLIDRETETAFAFIPGKNEFYVMQLSGSDIKKSIKLEPNSSKTCQVGNCQDGAGLYVYSNGTTYMGFFKNGKRHGPGQLYFTNDQYYIGNFNQGVKSGLGNYAWDEDTYYLGEWKNDEFHGKGVYKYSSNNSKSGLWQNGEFVRSLDGERKESKNTNSNIPSAETDLNDLEVDLEIFESVKSYVERANGDTSYLARIIDNDYRKLQKTQSGDELYKETSKYFIALYKIDPKLPFNVFMKWNDSESLMPIRNHLPKEIQDKMRQQAQGTMESYNEYMNSKETQDKIKKHGGGIIKQN